MEQLSITIQDGKIEMEVDGARGIKCIELTQVLEPLIGTKGRRLLKQDFYRNTEMKQKVWIKHRASILSEGNG